MANMWQTRQLKENSSPIAWYVDDNKFSHNKTTVMSNITKQIKKHFGDLSVVRGNKHTLLGIIIKIKRIIINIYMVKQLRVCMTMF